MKKVTFIALAFAAVSAVFTSCDKTAKDAPVITFTNIADSVNALTVDADNYDVTIKVDAAAELSKVVIAEDKNGTRTDKKTITTFTDAASLTEVYKVSGIPTAGIVLIVTATDKDDQITERKLTLKKKEVVVASLTTITFVAVNPNPANPNNLIGAGSSDFGSYVDLDGGKFYLSTDAKSTTYKSSIDVIFDASSLFNNDATSSKPGFAAGTGTNIKVTTLTKDQYNTANASTLTVLSVTPDDKSAVVAPDKVLYFETATNKGLILIKSLTEVAGDKNTISIEAKLIAK